MALGATGDPLLAERAASVTGRELRTLGINVDFAPVLDVNVNPENPVIGDRSFGSSPEAVARFGFAAARGYREGGVLPVAKHFPGHGDTSVDSHLGLPLVPHGRERLEEVELAPFRAVFDAGVQAVMTAHVRVPALEPEQLPATFSRKVLRDLLRDDMGFRGIVFTDSMGMGAIRKGWSPGEAAVLAFQAGADMLIYGADPDYSSEKVRIVRDALLAAVKKGEISRERLGASVERILAAKEGLGLFDDPFPHEEDLLELASPGHMVLARDVARRSLTVLRGEECLPVGVEGSFVILWPEKRAKYLPGLLEFCPRLVPVVVSEDISSGEAEVLREELSGREVLFAGCFDLFRTPGFTRFLRGLPVKKTGAALVPVALRFDAAAPCRSRSGPLREHSGDSRGSGRFPGRAVCPLGETSRGASGRVFKALSSFQLCRRFLPEDNELPCESPGGYQADDSAQGKRGGSADLFRQQSGSEASERGESHEDHDVKAHDPVALVVVDDALEQGVCRI